MKDFARIGVICVLLLSTVFGSAEELTHDFNALVDDKKIVFKSSNTLGEVTAPPALTYECAYSGTFNYKGSTYVATITKVSSTIITSEAIEDLTKIRLFRTSTGANNMRFWISTDKSSWTEITDEELIEYNSYEVTVTMPTKGNYYIKLGRATGTVSEVDISEITYIVSPCHCLRIVSE